MTRKPIPMFNLRNKLQVSDWKLKSIRWFVFVFCAVFQKNRKEHVAADLYVTPLKIDTFPVSLRLYLNNACFLKLYFIRGVGSLLFPYLRFLRQTKAKFIPLFNSERLCWESDK